MGLQPEGTPRAKEQYVIPLALPDIGALLESFADPVLLIDAETYRVLGWNRHLLEQYGFRLDEALRRPLLDLIARENRLELKSWLRASAPGSLDVWGVLHSGGKQKFRLTAHRMNNYQGTVFLLFFARCSSHDQSHHKATSENTTEIENAEITAALQEREDKFQSLAETTPAGVFIHRGQKVVFANRATEKITGYNREEIYGGEFWRQLVFKKSAAGSPLKMLDDKFEKPGSQDRTAESTSPQSEDLQTSRYQVKFVSKCGEERWLDVMTAPMSYEGSMAVLAVVMDITSHKEVEENLVIQKAYLERLIESAPEAIVIVSDQNVILRANSEFEKLFGYGRDEVLGKLLDPLIVPPHKMEESRVLTEFSRQGESASLETVRQKRDGSFVDVSFLVAPINVGNGQIAYYCIYRDITERKQDQQALEQSEAKFRAVAEMAMTVIYILNDKGKWIYVNPAAERVFEYSREELLGRSPAMLIHPDHREATAARAKARFRGWENSDHYELKIITKSGKIRWLDYCANLINFDGERAILGTAHDITELKRNELLQRALYRISEQASAAEHLDTLYGSIHEIIGELMEARNFYIALWDPASEKITFPYFQDETNTPPAPMHPGKDLTGYVLRNGQPLLATKDVVEKLIEAGELEPLRNNSHVWLGVPLRFGGSVIGALALQSYNETITYGEQEKYILSFVSQHVASALRRKRHEDALRESESRYRSLVQSAVHGMYYSSVDDKFEYVNQALVDMLGYESEEEVLRLKLSTDIYVDPEERNKLVEKYRNCTEVRWEEVSWKRKDGRIIQVRAAGRAKVNEKGETTGFEMIAEDLAERRMLEEQLRHSQKMEAVGRLAGGIAHDFNNLLTVIKGYSDLILGELKKGEIPLRREAEEVKKAADRASALVRQLLAFSRRQVLAPKVIDLNALIASMDSLLRPLLQEDIDLRTALQPNLGRIKADPGQIEQVIMNLAVNARDAMPKGGKLTIETSNVDLDPAYVGEHSEMNSGPYVMLAVSDSGIGMHEVTRLRVFEPFFTTKEIGKGTGLGLSMVYGIVKQSGGYIWVYSEPGRGTTFKIYLPRVDAHPEVPGRHESTLATYRGTETVLLLEDEDGVRALMRRMLSQQGYMVLEAKHGKEALYLCEHHKGPIHLLLADVVLEQMSGREVAEQLSLMRPEMKTLYISGYTDDAIVHHGVLTQEMPFLQKPFTAEGLIKKVRQVLEIG